MITLTINDKAPPAWYLFPNQVNCVDLVNETNKQIWLWAMPSPVTEGILAFRGQQAAVDNRFSELLNPKLPHAINFSPAKPKPELRRLFWDQGTCLTIARVITEGNLIVLAGLGVCAEQKTCELYRKRLQMDDIAPHPVPSLPPLEFLG